MPDNGSLLLQPSRRTPWNKGKLIGAKPPLRPKHVWAIRTRLMVEGRTLDLAMFNLAIDSKLRGCDVVALKVDGIAPNGYAIDRATVRQRKTGRPVKFEVTDQTRQAIDDYLRDVSKKPGEFLFTSRRIGRCMTTRQYARLVTEWLASIGLDPRLYGTNSLRRTKATHWAVWRPPPEAWGWPPSCNDPARRVAVLKSRASRDRCRAGRSWLDDARVTRQRLPDGRHGPPSRAPSASGPARSRHGQPRKPRQCA
jgi:hypothetical protein